MDQGIVIDYQGFGKTPNEGIWQRETTTTFLLFDETNAQPGEQIAVNAAGIRANEKSVNFYARVKLSYKFYNVIKSATEGGQEQETATEVTLADATKLITTSANFFGTNWVDSGSSDGYYYYATGTTLNKFEKGTQTFVDLFATDAKFVIEGEGFTGATSDGEGGGFVVGDTSINKIEVYFTLETLQGDATTEQAKALGWKIAQTVDFSKVDEGKIVTSAKGEPVNEKLNVTINDNQTKLEEVKFPYGEETILEFDSKNVDYITLKYSNGDPETFGAKADDFANAYNENTKLKVTANSAKGKVTGYVIGFWSTDEYKGFSFSTKSRQVEGGNIESEYDVEGGVALFQSYGENTEITIKNSYYLRKRDFKEVWTGGYDEICMFRDIVVIQYFDYPYTIEGYATEINSSDDFMNWFYSLEETDFATGGKYADGVVVKSTKLVEGNILTGTKYSVKEIAPMAFAKDSKLKKVTIEEGVKRICFGAFCADWVAELGGGITEITLPNSLEIIDDYVFNHCVNMKNITIPANVIKLMSAFDGCEFETVTIDSVTVAATDRLMFRSATIYVKSGLTAGSGILNECPKQVEPSDKDGYVMYTKA